MPVPSRAYSSETIHSPLTDVQVSSSSVEWGTAEWPYMLNSTPPFATPPSMGMYGGNAGASYPANPIPARRLPPSWPYPYPPMPSTVECYGYEIPAQDAIFEQSYAINAPAQGYILPDQSPAAQNVYNAELYRPWPSYAKGERPPSAIFEQLPTTTSYHTSSGSYSAPLAPITAIDPTSGFPSMGALAKSLPPSQHSQANDRMLPTPRNGHAQAQALPLPEAHLGASHPPFAEMYHPQANTAAARTLVSWTHQADQQQPRHQLGSSGVPASSSGGSSSGHEAKSLSSSPHAQDALSHPHSHHHVPQHPSFSISSSTASSAPAVVTDMSMSATDFVLGTSGSHVDESTALLYATAAADVPGEHSHPHHHPHHQQHHQQHHTLRARAPSTGSFSFSTNTSTEGEGSKRGSISSSGTDATLLHGIGGNAGSAGTGSAIHHLRHIQPAQAPPNDQRNTAAGGAGNRGENDEGNCERSFRVELIE
jgi:hypothetical protein